MSSEHEAHMPGQGLRSTRRRWTLLGALLALTASITVPPATSLAQPASDPARARNIQLCQGDAVGAQCETAEQTNEVGDHHQVTVLVTDAGGNPVTDVPVELREMGPATFLQGGGDAVVLTTAVDGTVSATLDAAGDGVSEVVAEISPPGTVGGFRGPGTNDDECEQPADPHGTPAAGNCVSGPVSVTWIEDDFPTICSDGVDNDGDSAIDMQDPGCDSPDDESEGPDGHSDVRIPREVSLRFDHGTTAGDGLVIYGRVRATDERDPGPCLGGQRVNVQRRVDGRWRTKAKVTTTASGRYEALVNDVRTRYRAVALRSEAWDAEWATYYVCMKAGKAKPHRHR